MNMRGRQIQPPEVLITSCIVTVFFYMFYVSLRCLLKAQCVNACNTNQGGVTELFKLARPDHTMTF